MEESEKKILVHTLQNIPWRAVKHFHTDQQAGGRVRVGTKKKKQLSSLMIYEWFVFCQTGQLSNVPAIDFSFHGKCPEGSPIPVTRFDHH